MTFIVTRINNLQSLISYLPFSSQGVTFQVWVDLLTPTSNVFLSTHATKKWECNRGWVQRALFQKIGFSSLCVDALSMHF
jgi:hypothetical protein